MTLPRRPLLRRARTLGASESGGGPTDGGGVPEAVHRRPARNDVVDGSAFAGDIPVGAASRSGDDCEGERRRAEACRVDLERRPRRRNSAAEAWYGHVGPAPLPTRDSELRRPARGVTHQHPIVTRAESPSGGTSCRCVSVRIDENEDIVTDAQPPGPVVRQQSKRELAAVVVADLDGEQLGCVSLRIVTRIGQHARPRRVGTVGPHVRCRERGRAAERAREEAADDCDPESIHLAAPAPTRRHRRTPRA